MPPKRGHRRNRSVGGAFEPERTPDAHPFVRFIVVGLAPPQESRINCKNAQSDQSEVSHEARKASERQARVLAAYPSPSDGEMSGHSGGGEATAGLPFSVVPLCTPHLSEAGNDELLSLLLPKETQKDDQKDPDEGEPPSVDEESNELPSASSSVTSVSSLSGIEEENDEKYEGGDNGDSDDDGEETRSRNSRGERAPPIPPRRKRSSSRSLTSTGSSESSETNASTSSESISQLTQSAPARAPSTDEVKDEKVPSDDGAEDSGEVLTREERRQQRRERRAKKRSSVDENSASGGGLSSSAAGALRRVGRPERKKRSGGSTTRDEERKYKSASLRGSTLPPMLEITKPHVHGREKLLATSGNSGGNSGGNNSRDSSVTPNFLQRLFSPRAPPTTTANNNKDSSRQATSARELLASDAIGETKLTPMLRRIKRTDSRTQINEVVFGALSNAERTSNSFIFLSTCDDTVYYGACVVVEELLNSVPSFVRHGPSCRGEGCEGTSHDGDNDNDTDTDSNSAATAASSLMSPPGEHAHSTQRVYVLVSKFPFFRIHFNVLHGILARERQLRFESQAKAGADLASAAYGRPEDTIAAAAVIYEMLSHYYMTKVPREGESLALRLPNDPVELTFTLMSSLGDDDSLLAEWCLPSLLSALPLPQLLLLVSCIMLEMPTVVMCSNVGTLANIVLALLPLLRPYHWQGPLVTVLPRRLFALLQAPVPFLCGVVELPGPQDDDICDLSHVVICDVDRQRLMLPRPQQNRALSIQIPGFTALDQTHVSVEQFDTLESVVLTRSLNETSEVPPLPGMLELSSLSEMHKRFYRRGPVGNVGMMALKRGHRRSRSGGDAIPAFNSSSSSPTTPQKQNSHNSAKPAYHEPLHTSEQDVEVAIQFLRRVRAHTQKLLGSVVSHMEEGLGDVDIFNDIAARKAIVERQPANDRAWFAKLMATQHFSCFMDELRESADESMLSQLQAASALEDKIADLHRERSHIAKQIAELTERHSLLGEQLVGLEGSREANGGGVASTEANRVRKKTVIKASLEALSMTYQKQMSPVAEEGEKARGFE
jgi:DENN (AEX-3) domain